MNYTQLYESRITKELDKKEVSLWKDFYNNILPERVEQFKKVYRGKPQKLQKAIEKLEQDAAASYREEIDEQLTTICDGLRTQAYFDAFPTIRVWLFKYNFMPNFMPNERKKTKLDKT